jgi:predicted ATPase/class 3 adenylate cyclase
LQSLLARLGHLSSQRAVEISLDLADALTRAHHLGIIYRDLKPANVLLAQDGTPRLTDFGIAQLADGSRLTQTGVLVGTVSYLSPEALSGEVQDFRTDIWAFGVLLFEMLTGRLPFSGDNITARITATLTQPVPDLTQYNLDIPKSLIDLIYRMLEKDRQQRIPSMRQVGAELESILMNLQGLPTSIESRFKTPIPSNQNTKPNLPTGTVTFLFTDIEGSTKLSQQYPESMPALLARHNEIMTQVFESHHGYVFQIIGDSFAVAFHNANDALNTALQAQRDLHHENWNPAPVKVRMGIHTGAAQLQTESKDTPYSGYATLALTQRIMSAGHGGQILISSATENLLRGQLPKDAALRDMGEKNLKDILLPERIYQLNVPDLPSDFAPLNTYEKIRHNLPLQLTTFIGREKEVEQIKKRLEKNHLVTLTGSGGIGKTRLSIQVASELLSDYPIGVWLVELAPVTDPALVPQSVCATLGVKPEGDTSALDALINYMHSKKILLVVDNCEHLIDACAQLCDSLLHACSDLRIIASSREALGIEGENAYRVPSLSLPNPKSGLHVIEESEAVKLFMERATTILAEFELMESNAPAIAQICQRLDGIALAIELAASRVKMLKVEQIAMRLDDAFRLLTGGSRTALPRQQTLRALIDWSYNLLPDQERIVLRKLSIFMGGWTLEAAEAVCGNADALDLLSHLVDKSLVSVDLEHGDEPRYFLLETVRQYAREKMVESEDSTLLRDSHLEYFVKTAERIAPELYHRKMPYWLDYLEVEYANLHAALEWAQERDVEVGLRLCNALYRLWENRGEYIKEGLDWIKKFLAMIPIKQNANHAWALYHADGLASVQSPNWISPEGKEWLEESLNLARELGEKVCIARALERLGGLEFNGNSNNDKARELLEQSLAVSRQINDDLGIGFTLDLLGRIANNKPGYSKARSYFEESLSILSRIGELRRWGIVLMQIGNNYENQGNWNAARNYREQALSVANEAQSRLFTSMSLADLGVLAAGIGDFDQAISLLDQASKLVQGTPDDKILPYILMNLGEIACFQGNFDQALAFYHEMLSLSQDEYLNARGYCALAHTECLRGEIEKARQSFVAGLQNIKNELDWVAPAVIPYVAYFVVDQKMGRKAVFLFGWVDGWNKAKEYCQFPVYQAEFNRYLAQARVGLSESEFNAAWAEGQSMSQEQVLALANEVLQ